MLKKQTPTEYDVENVVIFFINFFNFIVFYILGNIAFWVIWDDYLSDTIAVVAFPLWGLYLVFWMWFVVSKSEKISKILYTDGVAKNNYLGAFVNFMIPLSKKISAIKNFLMRPYIFVPLIIINLFIVSHGFALLKNWLVYMDPIVLPQATSQSLIYTDFSDWKTSNRFCWKSPGKGRPKIRSNNEVCDIRRISYNGTTKIQHIHYYLNDESLAYESQLSKTVYTTRLFPSFLTNGMVISKYNLKKSTIHHLIFTFAITLFLYLYIYTDWLERLIEDSDTDSD